MVSTTVTATNGVSAAISSFMLSKNVGMERL
jgi:hypothetical protein